MTSWSITVTLHAWWLLAYLAVGAVLWLPLEWWAWRRIYTKPRDPFWRSLLRNLRRHPYAPIAVTLAWPLAVWEAV